MRTCSKCYETHPEEFFNKDRSRPDGLYPQCKNCSRAACRRVYTKYHDTHIEMKRRWKAENPELHREISTRWQQANPEKNRQHTADYRARLARATPPWADLNEIDVFRSMCPPGYHVDHIHPLKGANFCGLNVIWNLQFLPAEEHYRKGTKLLASAGGCAYV